MLYPVHSARVELHAQHPNPPYTLATDQIPRLNVNDRSSNSSAQHTIHVPRLLYISLTLSLHCDPFTTCSRLRTFSWATIYFCILVHTNIPYTLLFSDPRAGIRESHTIIEKGSPSAGLDTRFRNFTFPCLTVQTFLRGDPLANAWVWLTAPRTSIQRLVLPGLRHGGLLFHTKQPIAVSEFSYELSSGGDIDE